MRQGIQTFFAELGEAGCLALCICELAQPVISEAEALKIILEGIKRGYILYDEENRNNPNNMFVKDRDGLFGLASGERGWRSTTEDAGYGAKPEERTIECWQLVETTSSGKRTLTHFRLAEWDPLKNSRTVQLGKKTSLRVFRTTR